MLEFIYSIIGAIAILCFAGFWVVLAVCHILYKREIKIIRQDMESCYRQGYDDGKKNKEYKPPRHITIEKPLSANSWLRTSIK